MEHQNELIPRANLIARPLYKISLKEESKVEKVVEKYLNKGLIHPSYFPFASLVLLVKEKDSSFKMCVDYRALIKSLLKMDTY